MRIADIYCKNFRNIKPRRVVWRSGLHLLCGANGAGKTNILEALSVACGWGNFGSKTRELISWNSSENAGIIANVEGEENFSVEISLSSRISVRVAKERATCSELRSRLPALCFLPNDMNIIGGTPSVRRNFIDKLCAVLSAPFAKRLSDYRRLVRHRIKLLNRGRNPDITTPLISSIGAWVWSVRKSAVSMIAENLSQSGDILPVPLEINLQCGGNPEGLDGKENFAALIDANMPREHRARVPLVGPHRDDLLVTSDGRASAQVLSRGQKRRATIALMIASGRAIERKLHRSPIFLIDEISSELDEDGREIVSDALFKTGWQIFAASAENTFKNWQGSIFEVREGEIICLTS